MKLTADLINSSASYINTLKDRELDLRDCRIPELENFGASRDQNDAVDLCNNDIKILDNLPVMKRLRALFCANNRIARIDLDLASSLPSLETLLLTNNALRSPADLAPLAKFTRLTHLICLDNPMCRVEHYRSYVIWLCPQLRVLDFQRVKDAERKEAISLFGTKGEPSELATRMAQSASGTRKLMSTKVNEDDTKGSGSVPMLKMSPEEQRKIKQAIVDAKSLEEVRRLEAILKSGMIPDDVKSSLNQDQEEDTQ